MSFSPVGRNEPLKKDKPKWKSEYPMTEGQLRSKRDEFWDTAPAFDGRKEIWDALKAAAVAIDCNDHELAQAIVDGASITLPHGKHLKSILNIDNDIVSNIDNNKRSYLSIKFSFVITGKKNTF